MIQQARNVRVHTDDVAPADRLDVWRSRVSTALFPLNSYPISDARDSFHADFRGIRGNHTLAAIGAISAVRSEIRRTDLENADPYRLQLFIPLSGGGVHSDDRGSSEVKPGSFFLTSADRTRTYTRPQLCTSALIEVDSRALSMSQGQLREISFRAVPASAALLRLVRDLVRNLVGASSSDADAADSLLVAAADLILRSTVGLDLAVHEGGPVRLEQVRQYFAAHLHDPTLTSEVVARALSLSRRTLFGLFERSMSTPMAELAQLRVTRAKTLLRQADSVPPLPEVAAKCGFSGPDQLYRVFHKYTGQSPAQFRDSAIR